MVAVLFNDNVADLHCVDVCGRVRRCYLIDNCRLNGLSMYAPTLMQWTRIVLARLWCG